FPALHSLSSQLLVHTHLAHFYQLALHHLTVVHLHWLLDFDYPEQLLLVFHFQFHHRSDLHSLVYQYLVDSSYYFANHYPNDGKIYVNPIENHPDSKNFHTRVELEIVLPYLQMHLPLKHQNHLLELQLLQPSSLISCNASPSPLFFMLYSSLHLFFCHKETIYFHYLYYFYKWDIRTLHLLGDKPYYGYKTINCLRLAVDKFFYRSFYYEIIT